MIFDPRYFLFMIPGLLLMLLAQWRLRSAFARYRTIPNSRGLTGAQAARLFSLRDDVCMRILGELVDAGYLRRDASGAYARRLTAA